MLRNFYVCRAFCATSAFRCLAAVALLATSNSNLADTTERARDARPNVVVFLSDDQGWGDFSFTGNQDLSTPNID